MTPTRSPLRARVFPDHWSFLLGQVALHSFVVVLLSGVLLMFLFEPSLQQVTYNGSYAPLVGTEMSAALASTLHISFEVPGGLLLRQVHHWASLLMIAAIVLHLLSLFFTGAFRRPRRLSWVLLVLVLLAAMAAGYTGTSIIDDMASGTSLAVLDGVLKAIPFIGTWLSSVVFGGPFPGDVIALFYPLHVFVLPMALVILFATRAVLALVHKPAQFPGPGRSDDNVVGLPLRVFAVKSGGFLFIVAGIVTLIAATITINPIWSYGPADPGNASAGAGPAWYLAFLDGALRLVPPGWEFVWLGRTWTLAVLIPLVAASLLPIMVAVYPYVEGWVTGDDRSHHVLQRPRNNATRTGIGVAGLIYYGVLSAAAGSNTIAAAVGLSVEGMLHTLQTLLVLGPVIGFVIARRMCLGLHRRDREVALHGYESGQIVQLPSGEYTELRRPVDVYERWRLVNAEDHARLPLRPDDRGRITSVQRLRARLSRSFVEDRLSSVARSELEEGTAASQPPATSGSSSRAP